jgi:DNA-directed RNA polymerase alpha subunit
MRRALLSEVRSHACIGVRVHEEITVSLPRWVFQKDYSTGEKKLNPTKVMKKFKWEFTPHSEHTMSTMSTEDDLRGILDAARRVVIRSEQQEDDKELIIGRIYCKQPGIVTAGDLQLDSGYSAVDKSQYIATYLGGAKLTLFLVFFKSLGHIGERQVMRLLPPGFLSTACSFSPVKRVNVFQQSCRTTPKGTPKGYFENLIVEISTNGSVTPDEALAFIMKALVRTYDRLISQEVVNKEEYRKREIITTNNRKIRARIRELKRVRSSDLGLSKRAYRALERNNIINSYQIMTQYNADTLLNLKSLGKVSRDDICASILLSFEVDLKADADTIKRQFSRLISPNRSPGLNLQVKRNISF